MNVADKVTLKQMYLNDTGQEIPDTDIEYFLHDVADYMGGEQYREFCNEGLIDEPDAYAIRYYVEWLEQKVLEK